eukprot:COSAG01_NODE_23678_length_805_cov_98.781870_1_plen_107_part_00
MYPCTLACSCLRRRRVVVSWLSLLGPPASTNTSGFEVHDIGIDHITLVPAVRSNLFNNNKCLCLFLCPGLFLRCTVSLSRLGLEREIYKMNPLCPRKWVPEPIVPR